MNHVNQAAASDEGEGDEIRGTGDQLDGLGGPVARQPVGVQKLVQVEQPNVQIVQLLVGRRQRVDRIVESTEFGQVVQKATSDEEQADQHGEELAVVG